MLEYRRRSPPIAEANLWRRMPRLLPRDLPSWAFRRGPPISWMTATERITVELKHGWFTFRHPQPRPCFHRAASGVFYVKTRQ
jgi:hypothetical protein